MPTPIPTTAAMAVANWGTSMSAATTPINDTESPSPNRATAIGSPTAATEPKATSRMSTAATSPTTSGLPPPCALRIGGPPSSIRRPFPLASRAISISREPVWFGTSSARRSRSSRVIAIVPSRETRAGCAPATPSSRSARSKNRFTRGRTDGSRAPAFASQTRSIESPEIPEKRSPTSRAARCDSDPAVSNSDEKSPASLGATATTTAKSMTQASSIRTRRR